MITIFDEWDESKVKRAPKGTEEGGQFISESGDFTTSGFTAKKELINRALKEGGDTETMYSEGGVWTAERTALHDRIIEEWFAGAKPTGGELKAQLIGGAPANGKSSWLESEYDQLEGAAKTVDQDEIKKYLPEYKYLVGKHHKKAAAFAHEESSYLAKRISAIGVERKLNMVQDSVFDQGYESVMSKVSGLIKAGYHVKMDYTTLDPNLSLQLAEDRFNKTGRWVPRTYIRKTNKDITDTFIKLAHSGKINELNLWDTNIKGQAPRLVASATKGELKIVDQKLWNDFLKKGAGTPRKKRNKK